MADQANTSCDTLTIEKIADAFAKAQGEFPVIEKNSKVEVYSKPPNRTKLYEYYYADLTEIIAKTRPALSKNGISFTQGMVENGFATTLYHSSGQKLVTGFIPCQIKATDYKEMAGALTYLKRISLSAALGISADEDVDAAESEATQGNSTSKSDPRKPQPPPKPKNYAPGTDTRASQDAEEFDQYMQGHPPDEDEQTLLLNELRSLVDSKSIAHDKVPSMIKLATGRSAKSTDLTLEELKTVIKYIELRG